MGQMGGLKLPSKAGRRSACGPLKEGAEGEEEEKDEGEEESTRLRYRAGSPPKEDAGDDDYADLDDQTPFPGKATIARIIAHVRLLPDRLNDLDRNKYDSVKGLIGMLEYVREEWRRNCEKRRDYLGGMDWAQAMVEIENEELADVWPKLIRYIDERVAWREERVALLARAETAERDLERLRGGEQVSKATQSGAVVTSGMQSHETRKRSTVRQAIGAHLELILFNPQLHRSHTCVPNCTDP